MWSENFAAWRYELNKLACDKVIMHVTKKHTVKPRYSVFQGTAQNYALYQGSLYRQHKNNYENTSKDQNLYTLFVKLC